MALPTSGERLVYDLDQPRLAVRLRPTGTSWIVIMWDRERRRKVSRTLGKCSDLTPEQARDKAARLVGAAADGQDIRRDKHEGMTLTEMVNAWHAEKKAGTSTADEIRRKVLFYGADIADKPASAIRREDIGAIHHHIATKCQKQVWKAINGQRQSVGVGKVGMPATADKWKASISAIYSWAQSKALVSENPCEAIQAAYDAAGAARSSYLHGETLKRFWKALQADRDDAARDAVLLMLFTGQRRGNVLQMRWDQIDLKAGLWSMSAGSTKQKAAQTTPLTVQAREVLKRRAKVRDITGFVFPAASTRNGDGKRGAMHETRVRDLWARVCKAAELSDIRPHDLRHTAGSWLARLGANTAVRQKALGHRTPSMAARYAHLELDPVAVAMQQMADEVSKAAGGAK